jgi:hypothetical protein
MKSLWTATGLSGVVCPRCGAASCPRALCAIVLFGVSFGLGNAALFLLRSRGADFWVAFGGFCVVFVAVYHILAPLILRLRLKDYGEPHLGGRRA